MLDVITLAEAKKRIIEALIPLYKEESLPLDSAKGRYLSEDIFSKEALPSFLRSTVDGYAVNASDTFGASETIPTELRLVGAVEMGKPATFSLSGGEAAYVPTGGMLPSSADAVVMLEYCENSIDGVLILKSCRYGENTISIGEDINKGELVFGKGSEVKPLAIGLLSALGITEVKVVRKLKAFYISSGDEIIPAHQDKLLCQIRDANTPLLAAMLSPFAENVGSVIVKDSLIEILEAVKRGLDCADIVILSGGSSVGARDYTYEAIEKAGGECLVHGVSLKPGKPTIVAKAKNNKVIFGLAGHTMASAVTGDLLVKQSIIAAFGLQARALEVPARASINFPSSPGRSSIIPISLQNKAGEYLATPLFSKSGLISALARADGYIVLDDKTEGVEKNARLLVTLL